MHCDSRLLAFIFCIIITDVSGLRCLSCNMVKNVTDCFRTEAQCEDGQEQCYLQKMMLPNLEIVYTAGCRSDTVCTYEEHQIGVGKRQIEFEHGQMKDLVLCLECCTGGRSSDGVPCNGYLCGQNPVVSPENAWCAECDKIKDPTKCSRYVQCPNNMICSQDKLVSGGEIIYNLGCQRKEICNKILEIYQQSHGKRDHGEIQICSGCCSTRDCNQGDCDVIQQNQQIYTQNNG